MKVRPRLSGRGKLWLKGIHITSSVVWLGTAICMHIVRFAWTPTSDGEIYAVDQTVVLLDEWMIIPSAVVALVTGALESWLTTWGFFKYRWVTLKWIVTVMVMLYGPLFQAQWAKEMAAISRVHGLAALQDPLYSQLWRQYAVAGAVMIVALAALPTISSVKPWMKSEKARAAANATRRPPRPVESGRVVGGLPR
jgi:uncharacterized membrane protein